MKGFCSKKPAGQKVDMPVVHRHQIKAERAYAVSGCAPQPVVKPRQGGAGGWVPAAHAPRKVDQRVRFLRAGVERPRGR